MRYFVQFSYFGENYHGWQKQPNAITVQSVLEKAFCTLIRTTISLMGAGRTDAGVHAKQMYAHFDSDQIEDTADLIYRLNALLPDDIAVQYLFQVHEKAHARFDAQSRTYEYLIVQQKNVFLSKRAHYIKQPLDLDKMNSVSELLLKHTNFECFSKTNTDVKTYNCDIKLAQWVKENDLITFRITADRFLRNMVRAIVGTVLNVGTGKCTMQDVQRILDSKDRSEAGTSVPAKGLYLTRIEYPEILLLRNG